MSFLTSILREGRCLLQPIEIFNPGSKNSIPEFPFTGPSWCSEKGSIENFNPRSIARIFQSRRPRSNFFNPRALWVRSGPGANQTKERSVHELFVGAFRNKSSRCESCLFSQGKTPDFSQKWVKFMNFPFWPFLWFGLPGRLLIQTKDALLVHPKLVDSCYTFAHLSSG